MATDPENILVMQHGPGEHGDGHGAAHKLAELTMVPMLAELFQKLDFIDNASEILVEEAQPCMSCLSMTIWGTVSVNILRRFDEESRVRMIEAMGEILEKLPKELAQMEVAMDGGPETEQ